MLSELNKLFKLIWRKKKMLWLLIMKRFFYSVGSGCFLDQTYPNLTKRFWRTHWCFDPGKKKKHTQLVFV